MALIERGDLSRIDGQWVCRELADLEAPASVERGDRRARLAPLAERRRACWRPRACSARCSTWTRARWLGDAARRLRAGVRRGGGLRAARHRRRSLRVRPRLTQQALYAGLSPVRRRRLHRVGRGAARGSTACRTQASFGGDRAPPGSRGTAWTGRSPSSCSPATWQPACTRRARRCGSTATRWSWPRRSATRRRRRLPSSVSARSS